MAISDNGFAAFASGANNLVVADEQLFSDVFVNRYNAEPLIATATQITADTPDPSQPNVGYAVSVAVTRPSGATPITGGVTVSASPEPFTSHPRSVRIFFTRFASIGAPT